MSGPGFRDVSGRRGGVSTGREITMYAGKFHAGFTPLVYTTCYPHTRLFVTPIARENLVGLSVHGG